MPKTINQAKIQRRVIEEMVALCDHDGHLGCLDPWSKNRAAIHISTSLAIVGVLKNTVKRWYEHWLAFKMLPCQTPRKWRLDPNATYKQWPAASLAQLKAVIDENPVLYVDEMVVIMSAKLGLKLTYSSVYRAITKGLNYSLKKVYDKASQQVLRDKVNFTTSMKHCIRRPEMAIFIDESNKDRKAARRKYGWSKVGTPVNYRTMFNMDTRYTLIGAADCFGFVIHACKVVMHRYKEKDEEKPVDTEGFIEYVRDTLCPVLGDYSRGERSS